MRKILCFVAAVMLLLGTASFAVAEDSTAETVKNQKAYALYQAAEDNTLPICNPGEITLTIYVELDEYAANFYQSYEEHPVVKAVEELTGLDLKFIHPPTGDDGTFFNMTIASGEYPDIFITSDFSNIYPGGIEGAVQDNVLADNDALIRKYAKNFLHSLALTDEDAYRNTVDDSEKLTLGTCFLCDYLRGINNMGKRKGQRAPEQQVFAEKRRLPHLAPQFQRRIGQRYAAQGCRLQMYPPVRRLFRVARPYVDQPAGAQHTAGKTL